MQNHFSIAPRKIALNPKPSPNTNSNPNPNWRTIFPDGNYLDPHIMC